MPEKIILKFTLIELLSAAKLNADKATVRRIAKVACLRRRDFANAAVLRDWEKPDHAKEMKHRRECAALTADALSDWEQK